MDNNALTHHGILGMKWGVRRYQNADGSLTAAGKKRQKKQQAKNLEKARKTREEKKQQEQATEEKRKAILNSRSAKDLYENAHLFTTKELQDAHFRLQLEKNIKDLSPKEKTKVQKALDGMKTAAEAIDKGSTLYNNIAKVHNAFSSNKWKTIGGDNNSKTKEQEAIEKVVKSGTAEEISKYFGKLSAKDYANIQARMKGEEFVRERMGKKQSDPDNDSEPKSGSQDTKGTKFKFKKKPNTESKSDESLTGEIIGDGKSSKKKTSDKWWDNDDSTIHDVPEETVVLGQSYVTALLNPPKESD